MEHAEHSSHQDPTDDSAGKLKLAASDWGTDSLNWAIRSIT